MAALLRRAAGRRGVVASGQWSVASGQQEVPGFWFLVSGSLSWRWASPAGGSATRNQLTRNQELSLATGHYPGGVMATGEALERPRAYLDVKVGELLARLAKDYPQQEAL